MGGNYPRGGGIEYDVDLHRRMAADISRTGEILVLAAPLVFQAQWSVGLCHNLSPRSAVAGQGVLAAAW